MELHRQDQSSCPTGCAEWGYEPGVRWKRRWLVDCNVFPSCPARGTPTLRAAQHHVCAVLGAAGMQKWVMGCPGLATVAEPWSALPRKVRRR